MALRFAMINHKIWRAKSYLRTNQQSRRNHNAREGSRMRNGKRDETTERNGRAKKKNKNKGYKSITNHCTNGAKDVNDWRGSSNSIDRLVWIALSIRQFAWFIVRFEIHRDQAKLVCCFVQNQHWCSHHRQANIYLTPVDPSRHSNNSHIVKR